MTVSPVAGPAFAGLCMLAAMGLAAPSSAQDGRQWHVSSFADENDRGRMRAVLRYGVPETDDVLFQAECIAGSGEGVTEVTIAADLGRLRDGEPIRLRFAGPGYQSVHDGFASVPQSGEGIYGVYFTVPNRDPFWQALAGLPSITYAAEGGPALALPLRGSGRAVRELNRLCAGSEGGALGQAPSSPNVAPRIGAAVDPRWQSCDRLAGLRSANSDTPVSVTFVNRSEGYRSVMWIGFDGVPVNYANLNPGESFAINTYLTHPWMFTDGPGNCIEMFMPQLGVETFAISAPNRDFGSE